MKKSLLTAGCTVLLAASPMMFGQTKKAAGDATKGKDVFESNCSVCHNADSAEKKELDPKLLAGSRVIVDELDQCAAFGELHHAITAGLLRREDALPELADVVSGKVPGRQREDETIVFDSTGFALEDAAAAVLVYERALQTTGTGVWWNPTA